ncbi:streptococcal hemagglutinin-like [Hetaerina americana]|uniref:streptococcal hemagglutinin-like n=1 Tax=Hetaerina americana TaxID=62018 RepID=UPI003A7F54A6
MASYSPEQVTLCALAALAVANAVPHGYIPVFRGRVRQSFISDVEDESKPVAYGYRIRTSSVDSLPISVSEDRVTGGFGYKVKSSSPIFVQKTVVPHATPVIVSHEESSIDSKDETSGRFGYSYHAAAPIAIGAGPVYQHSIFGAPVAVEAKGAAENAGEAIQKAGEFSYAIHAEAPIFAPAPVVAAAVPVSYEQTLVKAGEEAVSDKSSGAFSYSYHAEAPIAAAVPVLNQVVSAPVAVDFKNSIENIEGRTGAFSYAVQAQNPIVAPVLAAPIPAAISYEQTAIKSGEASAEGKSSGSFSYSYSAEAPIASAIPVAHHAVVASPVAVEYKDFGQKIETLPGQSGAFAYSIHAEAPVAVAHAPIASYNIPISAEQTVVKSDDAAAEGKPSGSFSYSYSAEAPISVPFAHHAVDAAPAVAVEYKDSAEVSEAVSGGQSGAFAYSVHAEAPIVAPAPIAYAHAPVAYGQTVVKSESIAEEATPSKAFSYSYTAEAPIAVPVPVAHHAVVAAPAVALEYKDSAEVSEAVSGGQSGAFAYSVHAEAPIVAQAPIAYAPAPVAYGQRVVKTEDIAVEGTPSKAFSYSYTAEAPIAAPVPLAHHAVVAAPGVSVEYKDSAEVSEAVSGGQSGAFAYSVHAEAPIVAPAPIAYAHTPVAYGQRFVKTEDIAVEGTPSKAFSYSYTAEAPIAAPVPLAHHAVVAAPGVSVEYKDSAEVSEAVSGGQSGAFAYSVHAEAPIVAQAPIAAPIAVSYENTLVKSEEAPAEDKPSGAFSYSYTAEAPVAAPVPFAHHAVVASPVAVEYKDFGQKIETLPGQSGAFAYSVHAEAPVAVAHAPIASYNVPISVEQTVVKSDDAAAEGKPSGSFSYSYSAEAPISVPVAHHAVVAAPAVAVEYKDSAEVSEAVSGGQSGAFAYSVHAEAPIVAPAPIAYAHAPVAYGQTVVKSESVAEEATPSKSFSYAYSAEAPIAAPVPVGAHAIVASPVAVEVKDSAEYGGAGQSGAFAYNVQDVAHGSYVAAAPIGVTYGQSLVNFGDKIEESKGSGAFGYSYHSEAPVAVAQHHVVAGPAPIALAYEAIDRDDARIAGNAGTFSYSVNADAPVAFGPTYVRGGLAYGAIPTAGAVSAQRNPRG